MKRCQVTGVQTIVKKEIEFSRKKNGAPPTPIILEK
jgi:hypothetical protein